MTLVRVIPRLDIKGPNLIKGIQFDGHRVLGSAEELAEAYYQEGADELIYQDAVASLYQRNGLTEVVKRVAERVFIPVTVAGGIRSVQDVQTLLRAGADKVAINTAATENPQLLRDASRAFGSQCIVSSIEAFRGRDGKYRCWVDYGRQPTDIDAIDWAQRVVELGVGEILLTSINNEGMGCGFDVELTRTIATRVPVPVIACGGAGKPADFAKVVTEGKADAVSAASIFHYHYARAKHDRKTMQDVGPKLRMGEQIDAGNIDFLNFGYGGEQAIMVDPAPLGDVKGALRTAGITIRENKS